MAYKITLKQGNIVQEEADFIVNASNTKLILGSGVSMAFKRHCGTVLQKELDELLEKYQLIEQGAVIVSSSGQASNFKYALQAAIMNYNSGVKFHQKKPTLQTIATVLENIEVIILQHSKSFLKIALPLMGCGVGGLKKYEVVSLYKEFFNKSISKEVEVVIYGYTNTDYELIKEILKNGK
jgi:O-acetyl-ADP-ribose deacetylase (regulator of RNase III)